MFVTNWISTTNIQKISEITNFFRHYFLSRTEVTGATSALLTILFDAKTLLTETITIAAIAANINFFIIVYFLNCYYLMLLTFLLSLWIHCRTRYSQSQSACQKRRLKKICVDYQLIMPFVPKVDGVENEESMWKHSPKSQGI